MILLKNTTTVANILKALLQCLAAKNLNVSRLVSITTNGTPSMVGKNKGVVSLLQTLMQKKRNQNNIVKLQCLIHQKALCAKVASSKNIMGEVNFIVIICCCVTSDCCEAQFRINICVRKLNRKILSPVVSLVL